MMECPLLVWMLSLNRDTTQDVSHVVRCAYQHYAQTFCFQEYDQCYNLVRECAPHTNIPYQPTNVDSFSGLHSASCYASAYHRHSTGQIITAMLPLLMMRHRRISRVKWRDCSTPNGKHWIEQVHETSSHATSHSQQDS